MIQRYTTGVNVILVDWALLAAAPFYDTAAANTRLVGEKLGDLLNFLVVNGFTTTDKIHLSGHSLGSHVSGFAGAHFRSLNGSSIARISALDPALPLFGQVEDSDRIDKTDAAFVDVIHTAMGTMFDGGLAFTMPRGHVDFYPNGGKNQPGCGADLAGACSHGRAHEFYAESVNVNMFRSCKCADDAWNADTGIEFSSCNCDNGVAYMGEETPRATRGIYYLTTNSSPPYSLG